MYESKKCSGRKEIYKYQKSSYQRHFHNSTHFNHHKYNKYKQKYDYSYSPNDLDEELIFKKVFDDKKPSKKNFKELDEIGATPNSHDNFQKIQDDNKENFSVDSNVNNLDTKMKTNDEILSSEKNETDNNKNNNMNIINFVRNDSEELLLEEKEEKEEKNRDNIKDEILNEIQNLTNLNNINFNNNENININNFNFNIENAINNLLNKNNDHIFASNEKENIRIDYKKNIYKTPQPFKTILQVQSIYLQMI